MVTIHGKIEGHFPNLIPARYTHDCKACVFIGQFGKYDCYYCANGGPGQTIVARYGNDGPEYASGWYSKGDMLAVRWPDNDGPIMTEATMAIVCAQLAIGKFDEAKFDVQR